MLSVQFLALILLCAVAFVIEGMRSNQEAETLALLLHSGSLAAPIDIVHETTVGPSMGEDNIQKGIVSIGIGFFVVIVFMLAYYRLFSVIANLGLLYNLVLIVTCLSFLDATIRPSINGCNCTDCRHDGQLTPTS